MRLPFFMYVALHASHYPHAAPEEAVALAQELSVCDDDAYDPHNMLQCSSHQTVQGQTIVGDEVINDMITKLKETHTRDGKSVWDNTVLFFLSDNGGAVWEMDNSPLRGGKLEIFEGGVRTPAFVSGGHEYLDKMDKGGIFGDGTEPFHVTDVYPTFLKLAGVSDEDRLGKRTLDGIDQLDTIQNGLSMDSEPREFVYNLIPADECENEWCGAYRFGDFKLIWHDISDADGSMWWYDFYATSSRYNEDGSLNEDYSNYLDCTNIPDGVATSVQYDVDGNAVLSCKDSPCLFNIAEDACEYNDLSDDAQYEALYQYMYLMMQAAFDNQQTSLKLEITQMDTKCDPKMHGGSWQPWMRDYNHDDATEDFEDILTKYAEQNAITEDLRGNTHYVAAQGFKVQWEEQQEREQEMQHGRTHSKMDSTMIWIMIGVITLLLIGLFISNKICKMRHIAKRIQQYPVDVRIQYEDEYTPLVK